MITDEIADEAATALTEKFERKAATVGVLGLGYVGLPLAIAAAESGLRVIGFDIDTERVALLNNGLSPLANVPCETIAALRRSKTFGATSDFSKLPAADAVLICVPTPLGRHREPDLSFVESSSQTIAAHLRPGQLVVLESTTYPGTTRTVVKPILETSGLRAGKEFYLAYSPEREDPGNSRYKTADIPKLVAGSGHNDAIVACALYRQFIRQVVPVASLEVAEAAKLTENIFRAVNIALVNELKIVFHAMNIDVFDVIRAASTKPFGYMPFWPGPGLGGHCIPIDPFYLTWRAREFGLSTRFIELAGEINTMMPKFVVARVAEELDRRFEKGLKNARVLLIGIAYKKNVNDMRESPGLKIWELLEERGAVVTYHDPLIPIVPSSREHGRLAGRQSVGLDEAYLARQDAVVVVTDHDSIDWHRVAEAARLVIDTRNVLSKIGQRDRVAIA